MELNDKLDGKTWQRMRRHLVGQKDPREGVVLPPPRDDMDGPTWQAARNQQRALNASTGTPRAGRSTFDMDEAFLADVEGARRDMHVPQDSRGRVIGKSGPTIGMGFDLGTKDLAYLDSLGVEKALVAKLAPYTGRRYQPARTYVDAHALTLSQAEFEALNRAVVDREMAKLAAKYDAVSTVGSFGSLPRKTRTAIASLYYQYGTDAPQKAAPNYWRQITNGDWDGALNNLSAFGDAYGTRRRKEAALIQADYASGVLPRRGSGPKR